MVDLKKYGFTLDEDDWIEVTEENVNLMNFPRQRIGSNRKIIKLEKEERWALVFLLWDNTYQLATRWFWSRIGDPNSRGYPTWHIIPVSLAKSILEDLHSKDEINESDYTYCLKKLGRK